MMDCRNIHNKLTVLTYPAILAISHVHQYLTSIDVCVFVCVCAVRVCAVRVCLELPFTVIVVAT